MLWFVDTYTENCSVNVGKLFKYRQLGKAMAPFLLTEPISLLYKKHGGGEGGVCGMDLT